MKLIGVVAVLLLSGMLGAEAQQTRKPPRIAILILGSRETGGHLVEAFKQGLRDLGYVEGENVRFETRWAMGKPERVPELAHELVALAPDARGPASRSMDRRLAFARRGRQREG